MSNKDPNTLMIQMNEELEKISTWLALNKLSLNLTKTHFILFKSSRKKLRNKFTIKIKDKIISQVRHTKFVGVIIDEHLSWKERINNVANKISKFTGHCDKIIIKINLLRFNLSLYILWKCCVG